MFLSDSQISRNFWTLCVFPMFPSFFVSWQHQKHVTLFDEHISHDTLLVATHLERIICGASMAVWFCFPMNRKMWAKFNEFNEFSIIHAPKSDMQWYAWYLCVDSSVSPVAELKMQRSRILAAGDCEENRLVHSTTLVAEIRVQVVQTSQCSSDRNTFEQIKVAQLWTCTSLSRVHGCDFHLKTLASNCEDDFMPQSCHFASFGNVKQIVLPNIQNHMPVPN